MAQIISSTQNQVNKNFSESTNGRRVTTRKKTKPGIADIPYLSVIEHYHLKGALHKCIIDRLNWPSELEKFGGKPLSYSAIKRKRRNLEKLQYIESKRERGRRREYSLWLTNKGIEFLSQYRKSYQQALKKRSLEKLKNAPSRYEKRPLESEKTLPPLIHANHVNDDHERAMLVQNLNRDEKCMQRLMSLGMYERYATNIYDKYGLEKIWFALRKMAMRKVENPGAYLVKFLESFPFDADEEFRAITKVNEINHGYETSDNLMQLAAERVLNAKTDVEVDSAISLQVGLGNIFKKIDY